MRVVHRGTWTHGLGPDFADAILLFGERELRSGSVEIHMETRDWHAHGHHRDPAYNTVILHVVARHDGSPTRRADGGLVPVIEAGLPDSAHLPLAMLDWNRVGGTVCAPRLARSAPSTLRDILHHLGDVRLSARSAQIEADLLEMPPADILWRATLGGLGYSRNQQPMRRMAEILPISALEELRQSHASSKRFPLTLGLMLGIAGFLPLAPTESHLLKLAPEAVTEVELAWNSFGLPWRDEILLVDKWDRARTRPANHPLLRIHAAAALVHNAEPGGGLLSTLLSAVHSGNPAAAVCELTRTSAVPGIGADRAVEILASGVLPVLFAMASHTGDEALAECASRVWEVLPAPSATSVTRRALQQVCGDAGLRHFGARGAQGLVHLDTALCQSRRCFECPIAAAELAVNE